LDAVLLCSLAGGNRRVVLRPDVPRDCAHRGVAWHVWCGGTGLADRVGAVCNRDHPADCEFHYRQSTAIRRVTSRHHAGGVLPSRATSIPLPHFFFATISSLIWL